MASFSCLKMLKVDIDLFCFKQIPTFYMKIYTP